ncbi:MAG TPA: ABC-2 family transporter protein [Caulobacteraceae bacterium]|nr:ABC-2 family transporter protein [Caulobacteraceae bacterium]
MGGWKGGRPLIAYAAQTGAAIRTAFADRGNFALQSAGMIVNDGFVLALWFMFFAGFRSVGGWKLPDVGLLMGLMMTIVGLAGMAFGGYRDMAATILKGEVDALLTQPGSVLLRLLARESIASAWGDLALGLVILALYTGLDPARAALTALMTLCGLTVYVGASVAFASLAFWIAGARSFSRDLTDFMLLFCTYPGSIFSGASKLVAYTVLPAGFVVLTPVKVLRAPDPATFATAASAALAYALIAWASFEVGLRRYRQGLSPMVA